MGNLYFLSSVSPRACDSSIVIYRVFHLAIPMAKKNDGGFAPSAGLMRYFDTEDNKGLKVSPKVVVGIALAFAVLIILLPVLFPV